MFNPFVASNSVNDGESFILECSICLFYSVIPIFQNLWGQGSWLTFLTGRFKKSGIYIPTFVTDNYQEVQKLWVWEIGLLYCLIGHVTNASFKQGVATLQVNVFAWSPFGDQFFWFRETFLQIKSPASKF